MVNRTGHNDRGWVVALGKLSGGTPVSIGQPRSYFRFISRRGVYSYPLRNWDDLRADLGAPPFEVSQAEYMIVAVSCPSCSSLLRALI